MRNVHDSAPDFALQDQNGSVRTLAEYKGKWLLIYFYPKDDTPGCTTEACTIAEVYDEFKALGVEVIGISKDSPQSHQKFAAKYHLPFTLLSDESTDTIKAYGAWQKKTLFGRTAMGTKRVSYLINPAGKIEKVYPKVDPANHALEILEDVRKTNDQ
ncbi:MAG: thioredoxin-dependent thiol peroxidase [Patescibacteria group bacterium]